MKTKRDAYARSKSPQKSFVQNIHSPQTTEQNDMIHDIQVEVHHRMFIIPKTTIHKLDIALHPVIDLFMTKILLLHNTLDQDMTIINETRDLIALLIDPPTSYLKDVILVPDIDHAHTQETTIILRDTHLSLDHLQNLEILDFQVLADIRIQEIKLLHYYYKLKMIQLILKYICIAQPKWHIKCCNTYKLVLLFIHTYSMEQKSM